MLDSTNGERLLVQSVAPSGYAITTAEAKSHLRVDGSDEDALIDLYIEVATELVEAQAGRVLLTQTWVEEFKTSSKRVNLTKSPVSSITSVKYYDTDNNQQTATLSDFTLVKSEDSPYINSDNWPAAYSRADAYEVTYVSGYGVAADTPAKLRQAILLIVGQYYEHRMNATEAKLVEMPLAAQHLINLERARWYG